MGVKSLGWNPGSAIEEVLLDLNLSRIMTPVLYVYF